MTDGHRLPDGRHGDGPQGNSDHTDGKETSHPDGSLGHGHALGVAIHPEYGIVGFDGL